MQGSGSLQNLLLADDAHNVMTAACINCLDVVSTLEPLMGICGAVIQALKCGGNWCTVRAFLKCCAAHLVVTCTAVFESHGVEPPLLVSLSTIVLISIDQMLRCTQVCKLFTLLLSIGALINCCTALRVVKCCTALLVVNCCTAVVVVNCCFALLPDL